MHALIIIPLTTCLPHASIVASLVIIVIIIISLTICLSHAAVDAFLLVNRRPLERIEYPVAYVTSEVNDFGNVTTIIFTLPIAS